MTSNATEPRDSSGELREIPGSYGLPVIGLISQTRESLRGWENFYRSRQERYRSTVFRTHMGLKAISVTDHQAIQKLFDVELVSKNFGFGPLVPGRRLVGDITPTVFSNDEEHDRQKRFLLAMQASRAPSMIPTLEKWTDIYLEKWEKAGSFDWSAGIQDLMGDFLYEWAFGVNPGGGHLFEEWTSNLFTPIRINLPGLGFSKALRAFEKMIALIRGSPNFPELAELAREEGFDEEKAAKVLLFAFSWNAWAGMQTYMRSVVSEFSLWPEYRERARAEIDSVLGGAGGLGAAKLAQVPQVGHMLKEVFRMRPPVSFLYNKARKDFVLPSSTGSFAVKKGEILVGIIPFAQRDPTVFPDPDTFDPSRYDDEQATANLIWSAGSYADSPTVKNKMCSGADIVGVMAKVIMIRLLQRYEWEFEEPPRWSTRGYNFGNMPVNTLQVRRFVRRS